MSEQNLLKIAVTGVQTVEKEVTQVVKEGFQIASVTLAAFNAQLLPDGRLMAQARLLPFNEKGEQGQPISVMAPDINALAAQQPGVSAVLEGLKSVVVAVAKAQGKI